MLLDNIREQIKLLNSDVNNVANSTKAKSLKKKLLTIGIILMVIGFGGTLCCFSLFVTIGFSTVGGGPIEPGFPSQILVPFILIVPLFLIGGIGAALTKLGLTIVISGYTANLIDETVWQKCPKCGDKITAKELFCNKCGHQLRKQCPNCNFINELDDKFCVKCGHQL